MALPKPQKTESKVWPKHPDGTHQLALADVIYLGHRITTTTVKDKVTGEKREESYPQERVALVWQSMECEPGTATRFELMNEFTWTASDRGNLWKFLGPWLGPFATKEAFEAIMEGLDGRVGENVVATIAHNPGKQDPSKVYVNVETVGKLMKGMQPFAVAGYVRKEHWTKKADGYKADHAAFLADRASRADAVKSPTQGMDEFPAALDDGAEDTDLPF